MLIAWEALAFIFALMPGIVGVAYCYVCGRKRKFPSLSGYCNLLKTTNRAKSEAYRMTASMFSSPGYVCSLVWLFMFIVAMVSPGAIITLSGLALCIPGSIIVLLLGLMQARLPEE